MSSVQNLGPALDYSPDFIVQHLDSSKPLLESMGRRLGAYLAATSALPNLDEAWCNAAYWYHEALAERLDTVAVAKLETAMEVLLGAESVTGSKKRLLEGFEALFGLQKDGQVNPPNPVTVDQLVVAITTARSRILHGTWPTLHFDLPTAKGKPTVAYSDVEFLTRMLLLNFSVQMDAYQDAGQTGDTTEALLSWANAARLAAAAVPQP